MHYSDDSTGSKFLAATILHRLGILGRFFSRSCFWFKSYKLSSNFIIVPLRKYSENRQPGFIHRDVPQQGVPGGTAALLCHALQLDDGHPDHAVLPRKAVILHGQVQFVGSWLVFATQDAAWIKNVDLGQAVRFNSPEEWTYSRNLVKIKVTVIV